MPWIEPQDQSLKALEGLHLWHAPMSSCSQRVRIVLAEAGRDYESHLVALENDEHASPEYQAIHPKGLVPALVDNGRLMIESVDIIQHLGGDTIPAGDTDLLRLADDAQMDLKLCSFEFLFRARPAPPPDAVERFQSGHQNEWLRQFRINFAKGFDPDRIDAAVARIDTGFQTLNDRLCDGRAYLCGEDFSTADVAWMPNVHRFALMDWPFDRTPRLAAWANRMKARECYHIGLLDWQPEAVPGIFADYTAKRRAEGTDIRSTPHLKGST